MFLSHSHLQKKKHIVLFLIKDKEKMSKTYFWVTNNLQSPSSLEET